MSESSTRIEFSSNSFIHPIHFRTDNELMSLNLKKRSKSKYSSSYQKDEYNNWPLLAIFPELIIWLYGKWKDRPTSVWFISNISIHLLRWCGRMKTILLQLSIAFPWEMKSAWYRQRLLKLNRGVVHSQIGCTDFKSSKKSLEFSDFLDFFGFFGFFSDFLDFFGLFGFFWEVYEDFFEWTTPRFIFRVLQKTGKSQHFTR